MDVSRTETIAATGHTSSGWSYGIYGFSGTVVTTSRRKVCTTCWKKGIDYQTVPTEYKTRTFNHKAGCTGMHMYSDGGYNVYCGECGNSMNAGAW